jgi:hypothetical protein
MTGAQPPPADIKVELEHVLEDDTKRILIPGHSLILDDTRVRQSFDQIDFPHELSDLFLLQSLQPNPLHRNHLTRVQVERAIHRSELSAANTITELL